jgi:hypothetical protein
LIGALSHALPGRQTSFEADECRLRLDDCKCVECFLVPVLFLCMVGGATGITVASAALAVVVARRPLRALAGALALVDELAGNGVFSTLAARAVVNVLAGALVLAAAEPMSLSMERTLRALERSSGILLVKSESSSLSFPKVTSTVSSASTSLGSFD